MSSTTSIATSDSTWVCLAALNATAQMASEVGNACTVTLSSASWSNSKQWSHSSDVSVPSNDWNVTDGTQLTCSPAFLAMPDGAWVVPPNPETVNPNPETAQLDSHATAEPRAIISVYSGTRAVDVARAFVWLSFDGLLSCQKPKCRIGCPHLVRAHRFATDSGIPVGDLAAAINTEVSEMGQPLLVQTGLRMCPHLI